MKKMFFMLSIMSSSIFLSYSQIDSRLVVGVTTFRSDIDTRYAGPITEKVVEMLTKSKRFKVVDRTSIDKVQSELEFQKTENFIDSEHRSQQGVMIGADYILTGHIRQINIARVLNVDGSVGGYRTSLSFTLKIVETATSISASAQSFESKGAMKALSPERAVDEAIRTLDEKLKAYFDKNFPVHVKIAKIITTKKDEATVILLAGGSSHGLKKGDKFVVQKIEMLEGKPYPSKIGLLKAVKIAGDSFAECMVLKGGAEILARYNATENIVCKLIQK